MEEQPRKFYLSVSNLGEPLYDDIVNSDLPKEEKVKQIKWRGQAYRDQLDDQLHKDYARIGLGGLVSAIGALPIAITKNPVIGSAIGGGVYELGQGIMEGDEFPELMQRAGWGGAIGGTVGGAISKLPQAARFVNNLSGGRIGEGVNSLANKLASNRKVLDATRGLNNFLNTDINKLYNPFKNTEEVLFDSANPRHRLQADLINKYNPAPDSYHTWVRNADDIYTFEDTLKPPQFDADFIGNDFDPSYTWDMAQNAIKNGEIEVFSSYPIEKGVFVTPSTMEAQSYAGSGKIYSKKVPLDDVAWIDGSQGQYAPIDKEYMSALQNTKNDKFILNWDNPEKSRWVGTSEKGNIKKSKSRYYNGQKYRDWDFDIRVSDHNKAIKGSGQWPDDNYNILDFDGIKVKIDKDFYTGNDLDIVVDSIGDFNKVKSKLNKYLQEQIPLIYKNELNAKMPNIYK